MKKLISLVFVFAIALTAAFVPADRAKKVAENQYRQYCADQSTKNGAAVNVVENVYEGQVTWYAFEFEKGFVIVSADDAVRPILGYSDHGKVPKPDRKGGENFKEWFGNYDKQIAFMRKNGFVDKTGQKAWKDIEANVFTSSKAGVIVDRLLRSEWDQGWPWNDSCYVVGGAQTPVGCIATAMAQISRYYRWPVTGTGSKRYKPYSGSAFITEYFSSCNFNYNLMPEIPPVEYGLYPEYWESGITPEEVGMLAHHSWMMGFSAGMIYAADGSSATMTAALTALKTNWYYTGSSSVTSFSTPAAGGTDLSYSTIKTQLDAKRPWQWAGGIHSFVLDGYRDDYWYHFNWGWGGMYDGWFHRSSLIPDGTGTGGGDGDYTDGQQGFYVIPNTDVYAAWPATTVTGSIANGEDITVNWTAKTGATGYEVWRTFNKTDPVKLTTTTSLSYTDNDLVKGQYAYHVVVKYATGESHISNSYSATVAVVGDYRVPSALDAQSVGRTSIDLTWVKPYCGTAWVSNDFEAGTLTPWEKRSSGLFTGTVGWQADDGTRWGMNTEKEYIHDGDYSAFIGYPAGQGSTYPMSWLYSPSFTVGASPFLSLWTWYYNNPPQNWYTDVWFIFYKGNFTETTGAQIQANCSILAFWDGSTGQANNKFESEVYFDMSAYTGQTGRIAVVFNYTDGYQFAVDDIVCGTNNISIPEPTGYQVFRNGSLAATTGVTTSWSDTGFADGDNTYYLRAVYPTGVSICTPTDAAFMDANPKPDYLSGTGGASAQLSWYYPHHNAPKWYCWYDPVNSNTTVDALTDTDCARRRVLFTSGMGYYYPATLDTLAAGFYEWSDAPWTSNQFRFRVWCEGYGAMDSLYYESPLLTAVPGQVYKYALPAPIVMTEAFNIEVAASDATTGHPANLAGPSEDGDIHSYFYYTAESSFFYYITSGETSLEYFIMGHLTSSAPPPIAKSGWVTGSGSSAEKPLREYNENPLAEVKGIPYEVKSFRTISSPVKGVKGIDHYNIYRNGSSIGTSTVLSYNDNSVPVTGDYTYKVTAAYTSPAGESLPSNEITLNVTASAPVIPGVPSVTTSLVTGQVKLSWGACSDATSYDIYSSPTPYGTFGFLTNVTALEYTYTGTETKMFFYVVSKNSTKASPKAITISNKKTAR